MEIKELYWDVSERVCEEMDLPRDVEESRLKDLLKGGNNLMKKFLALYEDLREKIMKSKFKLFDLPDLIIFGEDHVNVDHTREQAKAIKKYNPEFVLWEGLRDKRHDDELVQKYIKIHETVTLEEIFKKEGLDFEIFDKNLISEIKKAVNETKKYYNSKEEGIIPKSLKKLLTTPIYEMPFEVLKCVEDWLLDYSLNKSDLDKKIERVLDYIHYFTTIDSLLDSDKKKMHILLRTVAKTKTKLAGCDLSYKIPKNNLQNYLDEIDSLREEEMSKKMVEYVKKRKTKAPVIAIIGKKHLDEDSKIYPKLEEAEIKYKVIKQKTSNTFKDKIKGFVYTEKTLKNPPISFYIENKEYQGDAK